MIPGKKIWYNFHSPPHILSLIYDLLVAVISRLRGSSNSPVLSVIFRFIVQHPRTFSSSPSICYLPSLSAQIYLAGSIFNSSNHTRHECLRTKWYSLQSSANKNMQYSLAKLIKMKALTIANAEKTMSQCNRRRASNIPDLRKVSNRGGKFSSCIKRQVSLGSRIYLRYASCSMRANEEFEHKFMFCVSWHKRVQNSNRWLAGFLRAVLSSSLTWSFRNTSGLPGITHQRHLHKYATSLQ